MREEQTWWRLTGYWKLQSFLRGLDNSRTTIAGLLGCSVRYLIGTEVASGCPLRQVLAKDVRFWEHLLTGARQLFSQIMHDAPA